MLCGVPRCALSYAASNHCSKGRVHAGSPNCTIVLKKSFVMVPETVVMTSHLRRRPGGVAQSHLGILAARTAPSAHHTFSIVTWCDAHCLLMIFQQGHACFPWRIMAQACSCAQVVDGTTSVLLHFGVAIPIPELSC